MGITSQPPKTQGAAARPTSGSTFGEPGQSGVMLPVTAPREPGLGFALVVVAALSLLLLVIIGLSVLPEDSRNTFTEASQFSGYLLATIAAALVSMRSPRGRVRRAWMFIALALIFNLVAEAIYGYYVLVQNLEAPTPSWADLFYLLFYPFMAIGAGLLPAAPISGAQRLKLGLDTLIVSGALLSISWFFVLGPLYFEGADSTPGLIVSLAYPVGDLALIMVLFGLALRGVRREYRPVFLWLAASMIAIVYADSAYAYLLIKGTYVGGMVTVDPAWVAAALLMALAPLYQLARFGGPGPAWRWLRSRRPHRLEAQASESVLRIVLPYLPVVMLFMLIWIAQPVTMGDSLFPGLEAMALAVIVLIIARQVLTLRENARLARRQREAMGKLATANSEIELQRRSIAGHARYLEEAIQHLQETQVRVSQGDYSVRAQITEGGALFPLAMTFNLMLDRLEGFAQANQQQERLARMSLTLAHVSRRLLQGDATAMQALARPSGTPLDEIAQTLVQLQRRANELQGELRGNQQRTVRLSQLQGETRLLTDSLARLAESTQENASTLEDHYRQLERLAEEAERQIAKAAPIALMNGPLPKKAKSADTAPGSMADLLPLVRACVAQAERYCREAAAFATAARQTNEHASSLLEELKAL
ncbi:MAG TPA: hypothetical protein VH540_22985 [Ktedonobacterales bacterium]